MKKLIVFAPLALATAGAAFAADPPKAKIAGFDIGALDRSANACTDFYQFACGGWMKANPVPPDRPRWGRFDELQDRNRDVLREILNQVSASSGGRSPIDQKIGDHYAACMDEVAHRGEGGEAAREGAPRHRRAQGQVRAGRPPGPSPVPGPAHAVRLRLAAGLQGRDQGAGGRRPGRAGHARPRLLLQGGCAVAGAAHASTWCTCRRCSSWRGTSPTSPPRARRASWRWRPLWPRSRWSA